jgi:hypothetical protein
VIEIRVTADVVSAIADAVAARLRGTDFEANGAPFSEPWIGVPDAAAHIGAPESRIYDLHAQRLVRFVKDGTRLLTRRSWLDEYLIQTART